MTDWVNFQSIWFVQLPSASKSSSKMSENSFAVKVNYAFQVCFLKKKRKEGFHFLYRILFCLLDRISLIRWKSVLPYSQLIWPETVLILTIDTLLIFIPLKDFKSNHKFQDDSFSKSFVLLSYVAITTKASFNEVQ